MFKIQHNPTFKTIVPLSIAGQEEQPEIEVEFKYFGRRALREVIDRNAAEGEAAILKEVVVGWGRIDEPYSTEALDRLLDEFPAAASDFFIAYRRELVESKRKN